MRSWLVVRNPLSNHLLVRSSDQFHYHFTNSEHFDSRYFPQQQEVNNGRREKSSLVSGFRNSWRINVERTQVQVDQQRGREFMLEND